MCGIAGFIDYNKLSFVNVLSEMSDALIHRGPDDYGEKLWEASNANVGLTHRRLSIQDISPLGKQPMNYENLTIIFNGEVYNFQSIRDELVKLGYNFVTKTDTEVILKSYAEWGIQCIDKFRGMFVICIYDSSIEKLILIRDRAGVKPLYYSPSKEHFIFASEIKAILKYPNIKKSINTEALSCFFKFGYIHSPKSIYKGIFKLPPATYLEYDIKKHTYSIIKYWDISEFYLNKNNTLNIEKIDDKLEEILTDSFSLRMISDVPVGIFLSGGIDSSLIAAILQKYSPTQIKTFTIGFEDKRYDESEYAKKIARHLKTDHYELICKKNDVKEIIDKLPEMYDEPFADSSAIPTALVSKLASKEVSVVLSGDGGDELFSGYTAYTILAAQLSKIEKLPFKKIIRLILDKIPDPIYTMWSYNEKTYTKYLRFKNAIDGKGYSNSYMAVSSVFTLCELNSLLLITSNSKKTKDKDMPQLKTSEQMMLTDYNYYLPDDLLVKVDRATMGVSIEGREPFLDHKIAEFAAALPIEFKNNKKPLKEILKKYIPEKLFLRKKQGFGIPINKWLREDFNYLLSKYLDPNLIEEQGIFNPAYVKKLTELFILKKNNDRKIWTLLVFQMWYYENFKND